jgi:hypothetical protein
MRCSLLSQFVIPRHSQFALPQQALR